MKPATHLVSPRELLWSGAEIVMVKRQAVMYRTGSQLQPVVLPIAQLRLKPPANFIQAPLA